MINDSVKVVLDTINKVANKTSQIALNHQQEIDIYKEMMASQSNTYNLLLGIFIGVLTLFLVATYLYNIKYSKQQMIKEVDRISDLKLKDKILDIELKNKEFFDSILKRNSETLSKLTSNFDRGFLTINADVTRLYAITMENKLGDSVQPDARFETLNYWLQSFKGYSEVNDSPLCNICLKSAVKNVVDIDNEESINLIKIYIKRLDLELSYEVYLGIIKSIPEEFYDLKRILYNFYRKLY